MLYKAIKKYRFQWFLPLILTIACSCGDRITQAKSDRPKGLASHRTIATEQIDNSTNKNNRLDLIKQRGKLLCGINDELPGFSYKEADGSYTGLSVDFCRAIAAVLFNDPTKIEFIHLDSKERFAAVASGKVDILSRNTTWNFSRDTVEGLDFTPTNFYDGQGLLVAQNSDIQLLEDLYGKSICVPANTTSEQNLASQMRKNNLAYTPIPFEQLERMYKSYESGVCDAVTSDRSELVARRATLNQRQNHKVLDLVFSKEPLGSVIANDEPEWFDVVEWVTYATIRAEELGINSQNINSFGQSNNPAIRRFLGLEENLGHNIGLSKDFTRRIIQSVGNYGEIYERNIGKPFGLERGANHLVRNGGLMQSPPFR